MPKVAIFLLKKYEAASFISVISDGTTDSTVTEAEIVYSLCYCRCYQCAFCCSENVDTGRAPSIKTAIDEVMKAQFGEFMDKEIC